MSLDLETVLPVLKEFITEHRGIPADAVGPETRLMAEGYLDSFSLAALIVELERRLALALDSGDLLPEDFESPTMLVARLGEIAG